jgi:hypothetical protein
MDTQNKIALQLLLNELSNIPTPSLRDAFNVKWQSFLATLNVVEKNIALQSFLDTIQNNAQHIGELLAEKTQNKAA